MSLYYVSIYLYPNTPNPSFAGLEALGFASLRRWGQQPQRAPNAPNTGRMLPGGVLMAAAQRQMTRGPASARRSAAGAAKTGAQTIRHRCPEELILALMKLVVDDLPAVRASTLVALGDIRRDAKTALLRFNDDGVEYRVGVRMMRFPGGGFWARFVCPRCDGGSQRLRLLDGQPACVKCVRASGLIYRSQSIRTEKRHVVTAPPRIALICRDTPMRVNARPNRVAERRVNAENALRRSLIVARAWRAAKASKAGI
jgi:hypothetical protein